ncbi:MAG TPA: nuclear transport factor 2 family protein [Solirubrobacterales bacterium]|jgi:ketosteroid isomerase-like protein
MDSAGREELVRRSIAAWNADDWEDQLRAIWSPNGTIVSPEGWPESGEFAGWPAMLEQWRRIKGSWAEERIEAVGVQSIGERVLGDLHWTMRGDASGAPLEVDVAMVCEFEGGRLSKMTYFLDHESARAAAEANE